VNRQSDIIENFIATTNQPADREHRSTDRIT